MIEERTINLDDYVTSTTDDCVIVLQMLTEMHSESHKLWRATRDTGNPSAAWNYEKEL